MTTCDACSQPLPSYDSRRRTCSRCLWAARPRIPCSECGEPTGYPVGRKPATENPVCATCRRKAAGGDGHRGEIAHGTPAGRGAHRLRGEPPCDPCRTAWNAYCRERQAAARAAGYERPDRPPKKMTCDWCGSPVRSWAGRARDGLILCTNHRQKKRQLERHRDARWREARNKAQRAASGVPANARWPWVQGECRACGEYFVRKGVASPYCSKKCGRSDRPSGEIPISRRERLAIYERDGWICQLCSEPVDGTLHYLDDWAPSLDHIEPQSFALIPDHSPKNLRLAHRWCNSARGNRVAA